MPADPFSSPSVLAAWTAGLLSGRGIDEVAKWRMLEYWLQVELYRAVEAGAAGAWRHLGDYEQPYSTDQPRSGSKTNTKWVDLVLAEPALDAPDRITWIELKDVGRSADTLEANAKGLGQDLAALWSLRPLETQQIWLNPPPHVIDAGRLPEWKAYAPGLLKAKHLIGQIVIVPKSAQNSISADVMEKMWLDAFEQRTKSKHTKVGVVIGRADTRSFTIHALVHDLPEKGKS